MSKMKKCPACGKMLSKDAPTCPNCGKLFKKRGCFLRNLIMLFACVILAGIVITAVGTTYNDNGKENQSQDEKKEPATHTETLLIKERLAYLPKEIKDLSYFEVIAPDVYISFKDDDIPLDYKLICNFAAVNANDYLIKHNQGLTRCTVWLVPDGSKKLEKGSFYYVTARHGKVTDTSDNNKGYLYLFKNNLRCSWQ